MRPAFEHRWLLQLSTGKEEEEALFLDYVPPARDSVALPRSVLYVLAGVLLVIVATYAIVGHLINDLMHDLTDWVLGPKPAGRDPERGAADPGAEQRPSPGPELTEDDGPSVEKETDGPLPGYHQGGGGGCPPPTPPPPRSFIERTSTCGVTSARPAVPYATSL